MAIIKLSRNEQRRLSVFFTCLVLAFAAWVLTILSNPTPYISKTVLTFTNQPQKRSFTPLQSDTVETKMQGSGWDMLFSKMNMQDNHVLVSLKNLENKTYVVLSTQLKTINERREQGKDIITNFAPDTLYFDFSAKASKKVPVLLQSKYTFDRQFIQSGDVLLRPNFVIVSGPEEVIDKIKYWKTDSVKLNNLEDPTDQVVALQSVPESNIVIYPKNIRVHIPVSEFTEKTIEVPVKLINNKNYYSVKIFPQKVKITFTVALNKYADTDEHAFEAVADLNVWQEHGAKQLLVKVTVFEPYCKVVRIEPENLDFIVKE